MPSIEVNGVEYAYVDEGSGPLIVFGHGLLASREMFRGQIDALKDRHRCVSVDWPGHGDSGWSDEGWDFWRLADDTAALVEHLGEQRAVFAGLSQGGFAFMRLAVSRPDMVRGLILLDTSAGPEPPEHLPAYEQMLEALRHGDDATRRQVAEVVASILYGATFREREPERMEHEIELMLSHPREGLFRAGRAVFDREDFTRRLAEVRVPTLVVCGEEDVATTPDKSRELEAGIPGAHLVMIPEAGHHSALETPGPVTQAIEEFLAALPA